MAEPIIQIKDLSKQYGSKVVLKNISLTVNEGDAIVIIGPSGTGKSTLLRCINLLSKADSGSIKLDGKEINTPDVNEDEVRQHISMVFQDFLLFNHLTALGNIKIGLTQVRGMGAEQAEERAKEELTRVGLAENAGQYPGQLSGGQKQRVSIARALAMDPEVMLLDEPTSALDPELIGEVHEVIRDLASGGMTMLLVTHEVGFASSLADEIFFMEDGKIVEQGPPQKILFNAEYDRTREFCAKIGRLHNNSS